MGASPRNGEKITLFQMAQTSVIKQLTEKKARKIINHFGRVLGPEIQRMRFGRLHSAAGLVELAWDLPKDGAGLEIGSFSGESTVIFRCCGAGHVTCVDIWGGPNPDDRAKSSEARFDRATAMVGGVEKIKGDSVDAMGLMVAEGETFDWVYIDGDHSEEAVAADIIAALPLVKPGGFLCGHDYGRTLHPGVSLAVDRLLGKPERVYRDSSWLFQSPTLRHG